VNMPPLLITSEFPTVILKLFVLLAVTEEMVQEPVLPAFHVPGKDLQIVPFRDGVESGLAAIADGVSVTRSMSAKIPIRLLDLFILRIFNTSLAVITPQIHFEEPG